MPVSRGFPLTPYGLPVGNTSTKVVVVVLGHTLSEESLMFYLSNFLIPLMLLNMQPMESGQSPLVYVKKATRDKTLVATLIASHLPRPLGHWYRMGPFENPEGQSFDIDQPFEQLEKLNSQNKYRDRSGRTRGWRIAPQLIDEQVNGLNFHARNTYRITYLYREIHADKKTAVRLSLGSGDGIKVFLNGKLQLSHNTERTAAPDQELLPILLQKGSNHLLLKICNLTGSTAFYFRMVYEPEIDQHLHDYLDRDFPVDAENRHYQITTLPIPEGVVLEVGGMAFAEGGDLLICTRRGDIYRIKNPNSDDLTQISYHRFASGLHEPLGMVIDGDDVYVVQRPELTRLRDTTGDGIADEFVTLSDAWGLSGDYHEYAFGPARDNKGNFFITLNVGFGGGHQSKAPWRGWCVKVAPDGTMTPWAVGLRSPNGINFSPQGDLFYVDNQGEWVATNKMHHIQRGDFFGHAAGLRWHPKWHDITIPASGLRYDALNTIIPITPPCIWFPYGKMGQSASEPIWDTSNGQFGPFQGQCFVGDQTKSTIMRVFLEKVNDRFQGACFPFRNQFLCGVNRLVFDPDGNLYVGMTNRGWGSVGGSPYGLQRLRYTGRLPFEIQQMRLRKNGLELGFTKPIGAKAGRKLEASSLLSYTYHHWRTYGSPEIDRKTVKLDQITVSSDSKRVLLNTEQLVAGRIYELHIEGLISIDDDPLLHPEAYYTLNELIP